MPADISIDFPKADADRLFEAMKRAERDLHKTAPQALQWAARTLAGSLAAQTRVSAQTRPVRRVKKHSYDVVSWKGGTRHVFRRHGESAAAIKKLREVRIAHSGFAKVIWRFMGASFGGGGGNATSRALKFAARYGSVQLRLGGDNPTIILDNRSGYAESALKGGAASVGVAMAKAATRMEKSIDHKLARIAAGGQG